MEIERSAPMRHVLMPISVILACLLPTRVFGQWVEPKHVTFAGLEYYAGEVKKCVFAIELKGNQTNKDKRDDWQHLGTGFMVRKEKGSQAVGITCCHVVNAAGNNPIFAGMDTDKGFLHLPCEIIQRDTASDLAVLIPQSPQPQPFDVSTLAILLDDFAKIDSIVEGRGVIIPGYPLGLGVTEERSHPVVRFGIVAQRPLGKTFLIDGVASHGNSGSPVYLLKEKKVIGMITSHVADHITLLDERGQLSARLPYNSGLGRALTAAVIKEALEKLKF